ncbi:AfsR/SARP family transcriptional regulator [Planomonospora venezuelensis]|uniref:DNA-binding SARP family transcriptional activator/Tfp pilus assembly protein PilF n=1 Tax=Planomonospora venezuelensis TaxID=1999 RepID=A0A841D910_PLAVE|nr:BTAD domain-containing putative transcriptional regulator [Planomonospora venezuelensis]MBB5964615.1 DNA-binding SARP family transcriptional activator/Tfp pilus assembly protein PilF [Planomonospora venezuelensis]GIN02913.1 SARP family transcriptional regulator [Planomonospora venezuelensis]
MVEFRVLGPLEIRAASGQLLVPKRRKTRTLLAVLLLRANTAVSADELLETLWEEDRPPSARANLQSYVSELRKLLGGGIALAADGYLLTVDEDGYDAARFRALAGSGQRALAAGRSAEAAHHLAGALALWRGDLVDGLPLPQWLWPERAALEEARLSAYEDLARARLALGQHDDLVAGLIEFTGRNPLREKAWALLMLALHRCGRTAEAVDSYQSAREVLKEELGVAPNRELRELHGRILREDPGLLRPPGPVSPALAAVPRPHQLPAGVGDFVGRSGYLRVLDDLFRTEGGGSVSCALTGTGGVGKTALAVHWANSAAARFPDGQLYVDLRGFTPSARPMHPIEALSRFLRSLGVPPEQIPLTTDEAASLYRSLLSGKRVLVLLDNAFDGDQVRPLIPPVPSCTLITSRDRLDCLAALDGVRRIGVDVMSGEEAGELLRRITGAECERLARFCDHLPLALRLAATQIAGDPRLDTAAYLKRLDDADPLDLLDGGIGRRRAIRSAFDLSYRRLPYETRRLFRALSVMPGADFTAETAAAVLDAPLDAVAASLDVLSRAHLVTGDADGRFGLHDLLRAYALERFGEEDDASARRRAHHRLTRWYLRHARAASELVCPQMIFLPADLSPPPSFGDEVAALRWLESERHNLLSLADRLAGPAKWLLVDALRGYWYLRRHSSDWLRHVESALAAAESAADPTAQAAMRGSLAEVCLLLERHTEALGHNTAALELSQTAGWTEHEAATLGRLGTFHLARGEPSLASEYCLRAIEVHRRAGVHRGVISNLGNLGLANIHLGNLRHAAEQLGEALRWERERRSTMGEAIALGNLGLVAHHMGEPDLAATRLDRALELFGILKNEYGTADTLSSLAAVHHDVDAHGPAHDLAVRARDLARAIGDTRTEASATSTLGTTVRAGAPRRAARLHEQALSLALTGHFRYETAQAHIELAVSLRSLGDDAAAARHAEHALAVTRRNGFRRLEGYALLAAARPDQAGSVFAEVGDALGLTRSRRSCMADVKRSCASS